MRRKRQHCLDMMMEMGTVMMMTKSSTLSRDDFFFLGAFLKMTMMVGTMTQCRDDGGNGDGDDDDDIVNIVSR